MKNAIYIAIVVSTEKIWSKWDIFVVFCIWISQSDLRTENYENGGKKFKFLKSEI